MILEGGTICTTLFFAINLNLDLFVIVNNLT